MRALQAAEIFLPGKVYTINQRDNDRRLTRSKKIKAIRGQAAELWAEQLAGNSILSPVGVVGYPFVRRPLDVDSAFSTLGAMLDGLVDAGGIPDDTSAFVDWVTLSAPTLVDRDDKQGMRMRVGYGIVV